MFDYVFCCFCVFTFCVKKPKHILLFSFVVVVVVVVLRVFFGQKHISFCHEMRHFCHVNSFSILKDARSVSLYPYN